MDANTKKRYDKAGPQVVKALEKRHFEACYVSTAAEAVEKVVELIPKEHTVSWGGTATVDALGIKQRLAQEGIALIDRDTAQTPQERQEIWVLNPRRLSSRITCRPLSSVFCISRRRVGPITDSPSSSWRMSTTSTSGSWAAPNRPCSSCRLYRPVRAA